MSFTAPNKRFLPKSASDWWAFSTLIVTISSISLIELIIILPRIYETSYLYQTIIGVIIYVHCAYCFIKLLINNSTTSGIILPAVLQPGWKYCAACEANSPPRAFHCPTCDICILRRDHHCTFTGSCIGFNNYRFYINFLSYVLMGALYCNYLNFKYASIVFDEFSFRELFIIILPILAFLLGFTDCFTFFISFTMAVSFFGSLYLMALLGYHFGNALFGQTTYERSHGIKTYNVGWKENVSQVFGSKWPLALVLPWVKSPIAQETVFGVVPSRCKSL